MRAPRPATVLAYGLGVATQPLIVLAGWLLLQRDLHRRPKGV